MKTSDVNSNRPVQTGSEKAPRSDKKPQKEFDKVLEDGKGQKGASLKKEKPFSPLGAKQGGSVKKTAGGEKKDLQEAVAEGKSEKSGIKGSEQREYSRVEARGEKGQGEQEISKKETSEQLQTSQMQAQPLQGQTNVQEVSAAQATQRPGLNIDEIQSIVNKVELAVNEKGAPEFRFELQTKNLGNIDLKVSTENEQVRIEFATQDAQSQEVLRENLKELGEMLQQRGLVLVETKFAPRNQEDAEKQQQQQERQEQGDDISPIEGGPRRTFRL